MEAENTLLYFKNRYKIISAEHIEDLISGSDNLDNRVILTIDDGWKSTYDYFYPMCKKHNIPVTIFVSPQVAKKEENLWFYKLRYCDKDKIVKDLVEQCYFTNEICNYHLEDVLKELQIDEVNRIIDAHLLQQPPRGFCNVDELRDMYQSGLVTIGAHTLTHPILASESQERANKEIYGSIQELSAILQAEVSLFAYPNGLRGLDFGKREMLICKENGIKWAFSVDPGILLKGVNTMAIPRCGSIQRLKLGRLGMILPSFYNQAGKRKSIKQMKR